MLAQYAPTFFDLPRLIIGVKVLHELTIWRPPIRWSIAELVGTDHLSERGIGFSRRLLNGSRVLNTEVLHQPRSVFASRSGRIDSH